MGAIRQQDKAVFADAARHFNLWILVRRTNRESLPYIGLPGYTPKPIDCKAKTADSSYDSRYRTAGLVVDPNEHRRAFGPRLADALSEWKKFPFCRTQLPDTPWIVIRTRDTSAA